ncbi:MAG: hypothetical protein VW395_05985 [Methylotenera sp.]
MYSEEDYIKRIIPHRLNMIEIMLFAMTEMRQSIEPKKMMVYVDDKLCFKGLETAFTNPAIEAGIINCRAMLEFLGLELKKENLDTRSTKKYPDQKYIEDFKFSGNPLEKVTPAKVTRLSKTDGEKGVEAIARLLQIANKEIAHITDGRSEENDRTDFELLVIGARGIRALTVNYFYIPLGLNLPEKLIQHT